MRIGLMVAALSCGMLSGLAWLRARAFVPAEPIVTAELAQPQERVLTSIPLEGLQVAEPIPTEAASFSPILPFVQVPASDEAGSVTPAAAERIARHYFHAQVNVEELERALPADDATKPRTAECFPGYFAAVAERDQFNVALGHLPAPTSTEALPLLDLFAEGDDFARIYRAWSREDLLVEHWRISRAAYAE